MGSFVIAALEGGALRRANSKSCGKRPLAAIVVMRRINVCFVIASTSVNPISGIKIDKVNNTVALSRFKERYLKPSHRVTPDKSQTGW